MLYLNCNNLGREASVITIGLVFVLVLVSASVFVNGWTDAPNAIATVVSTRVLKPGRAVLMAAVLNLAGVIFMGLAVATTIKNIIILPADPVHALITLAAAQLAIIIWAVGAWMFGIPTSESHALVAGLTGAGVAINNSFEGVNPASWIKVFEGLGISAVFGFLAGLFAAKLVVVLFKRASRGRANSFFDGGQIFSAGAMAFSHGAQDGQKFAGVFLLALSVGNVIPGGEFSLRSPAVFYVLIFCSLLMALGTSLGGYKIIKSVGMDMVKLEKYQGFAADLAASACLLVSTKFGIPLSTTQTKTTAIMGVGAARGLSRVKWKVVLEMFTAWALTFPVCGLLGFLSVKALSYLFLRR